MSVSTRIDGPQRTCVGCRAVVAQHALVRVTLVPVKGFSAALRVDSSKRHSGRGAYVHARPSCLAKATKGGFSRSYKISVSGASITQMCQEILSVRSEGSYE